MRDSIKNIMNQNIKNRASVLVIVLIVLSSMIILSVGFAYRTQMELQQAYNNASRVRAYYLAVGGIERIKALFNQQEITPEIISRICPFSSDIEQENLFEQVPEFESAQKKVLSYSLRDEQGLLNINVSDPACWMNIQTLFINQDFCSSILDWTDEDNDTSIGGAETDYYQMRESPYSAKNKQMKALKEILFLKGMNHNLYIGEDLNRNDILDENEGDGLINIPFDNEDTILDKGVVDIFTVYGDGKININTVPAFIISAQPGLDDSVAYSVSRNQAGTDQRLGTSDDICYKSINDIANIKGLNEMEISLLQEYCCFNSEYFRVFSSAGENEYPTCCLMATVKLDESKPKVLYVERLF